MAEMALGVLPPSLMESARKPGVKRPSVRNQSFEPWGRNRWNQRRNTSSNSLLRTFVRVSSRRARCTGTFR